MKVGTCTKEASNAVWRRWQDFRAARCGVLLSSDVSARGVDYPDVTLVLQLGSPSSTEQYIHRLGRTGRAGKRGRGAHRHRLCCTSSPSVVPQSPQHTALDGTAQIYAKPLRLCLSGNPPRATRAVGNRNSTSCTKQRGSLAVFACAILVARRAAAHASRGGRVARHGTAGMLLLSDFESDYVESSLSDLPLEDHRLALVHPKHALFGRGCGSMSASPPPTPRRCVRSAELAAALNGQAASTASCSKAARGESACRGARLKCGLASTAIVPKFRENAWDRTPANTHSLPALN